MLNRMLREVFSRNSYNHAQRRLIYIQALIMIGSILWLPLLVFYIWRKLKTTKRKAISIAIIIASIICPTVIYKNYKYSRSIWDPLFYYFKLRVVRPSVVFSK